MSMSIYTHKLTPHQKLDGTICFDVVIYSEHDDDFDVLNFHIDGDGSVTFSQSELISPQEITDLGFAVIAALKEAREFSETNWNLDQIPHTYNSNTSIRLEHEGDILGINFSILDENTEIQTGEVDWQKGVYLWNRGKSVSPQHIIVFFEKIRDTVYAMKGRFTSVECLDW
jgi:hypothetical protein